MTLHSSTHILDSIRFNTSFMDPRVNDVDQIGSGQLIGEGRREKTFSLDHDLLIPPHFTRYLDKNIRTGISLGASLSGLNINIHEGINRETEELIRTYHPPVILDISWCRSSMDVSILDQVDCIWLDLTGPEPGYFSPNIENESLLPPEIDKKKDLIHLVSMLKELTDVPVIVSLRGSDVKNDLDNILVTDADGIHVSCGYDMNFNIGPAFNGLTSEPVSTIIEANKHFEVFKSKDKNVKFILSGPIRNGPDILKLFSLGVDIIGPEYVIASVLDDLKKGSGPDLEWDIVGEGVDNALKNLKDDIIRSLKILNKGSTRDLSIGDLHVDTYHAAAITGLPVMGYGQEIPFWRH